MPLEQELAFYRDHLPELLSHNKGQLVVIKGDRILGTYTTIQEAFEAGVKEWGTESFLIMPVADNEPVANFPALQVGLLYAHPQ